MHASGKAIVADEIVTLIDVRGKTAGGSITTSGKLNFHDEPTALGIQSRRARRGAVRFARAVGRYRNRLTVC